MSDLSSHTASAGQAGAGLLPPAQGFPNWDLRMHWTWMPCLQHHIVRRSQVTGEKRNATGGLFLILSSPYSFYKEIHFPADMMYLYFLPYACSCTVELSVPECHSIL